MNRISTRLIRSVCLLSSLLWLDCMFCHAQPSDDIPIDVFLKQHKQQSHKYIVQFTDPPISQAKQNYQQQTNSETQVSAVSLSTFLEKKQTNIKATHTRFLDDLSDHLRSKQESETGLSASTDTEADNDAADKIRRTFSYLINGVATELDEDELEFVQELSYVQQIYPDRPVTLHDEDSDALIHADDFRQLTGATGSGIVIAIIDTGVDYLHPDLGGGIGPSYKVIAGYDFINEDNDPMDDNGHGTHCAGIAAANGSLKGIAPDASILAYKVLNTAGNGIFSDIIAALEKAADPDGNASTDDAADVVSISIGGYGDPDDSLSLAVDNAVAAGIACVIAAGNEYNYYSITSPGCARDAITVGATDKQNEIAPFSSRGPTNNVFLPKPDVLAPGVDINSTLPDGQYGPMSGTSMATPHVAGAVALVRQVYPSLGPLEVKNLLRETAVSIGEDAFTQGSGLVNLSNIINASAVLSPAVAYMGDIGDTQTTWQTNKTLTIKNISSESRTFSMSWESDMPPGMSVSFSSNTIVLAGGSSTTVTVYITVDTTVLPSVIDLPYIYDGFVVCQDTTTLNDYRVQLIFHKEQPDPFEPNNTAGEAWSTTVNSTRQIVKGNGRSKIDPDSGSASNPDYDWFSFTGQAGDIVTLDVNAFDMSSSLDSEMILYNSSFYMVDWNDDYGYHYDPLLRNLVLPYTDTYYLEISGEFGSTGMYQLVKSKKPSDISWFTSISSLTALQLLDEGSKLLITSSSSIQILDTTNDGLQLWQISSISPVATDASESSDLIALIDQSSSTYQLIALNTSTSAAQWQYTFPSNHIPSDLAVSRDGSTIAVYCEDSELKHCIIYVFNRLSSLPEFVYSHETHNISNGGFSISADGSLVVFSDLDTTYVLDTSLQTLRWSGTYANRAYTISNDGTYLTGSSEDTILTLRKWNGTTYEKVWDFNPGNNELIFRTAISGNGQTIVSCQRMIAGFYGLDDDGIIVYVFDKSSNVPLYSYKLFKDRDNTPNDDLFGIPVPNAVDEIVVSPDGQEIAVSLWGADPEQPEILFFSPENPKPTGVFYALGSVSDISMVNDTFCFYSEGKHNFHFFRFFVEQELAGLDLATYLIPVAPFIKDVEHTPQLISPGDTLTISANITDTDGVSSATVSILYDNDTPVAQVPLNDDGTGNDQSAGDNIYTGSFTTDSVSTHNYYYIVSAQDTEGNTAQSDKQSFTTAPSPLLSVLTIIEGDTALHPGTKSKLSLTITNSGTAALTEGTATMFIQDQYMDAYYRYAIDMPALAIGESASISENKLYVTPKYTVPHEYLFSNSITIETDTFQTALSVGLPVIDTTAPFAQDSSVAPKYLSAGETIVFTSTISDGSTIVDAQMIIKDRDNDAIIATIPLYDDGLHGDEYENDGIYGNSWTTDSTPHDYAIQVYAKDALNNEKTYTDQTLFTTIPFVAQSNILLVNDTVDQPDLIDTYTDDLDALSIDYDLWDTPTQDEVPSQVLAQYESGIVIWVIGMTSGNYHVSTDEQDSIMDYLDAGGNLIITGQQVCYYLTLLGQEENTLLKQYLGANLVLKDTNCIVVDGISGNAVSDGYSFTLENQGYTGEIDPISPAVTLLEYDTVNGGGVTYSSGSAAVIHTSESFRSVLFDFDISGLSDTEDRQEFLEKFINYLTSPKITDVTVTPTVQEPGQDVQITAVAYDSDSIQSVHASIHDSTKSTVYDMIELFDDGAHGDGEASDNIYGNTYTTSTTARNHYVTIYATDTLSNESESIEPVYFSTLPYPNLVINDITPYSSDHFAPNTLTYFDISVLNNGTLAVSSVDVVMDTGDSFVQYYSTSQQTVSAINPGAIQSTSGGKFYIKLSSNAPHDHDVKLNFTFTDTSYNEYTASYTITVQDTLPPVVSSFTLTPRSLSPGGTTTISAKVIDGMDVASVEAHIYTVDGSQSWGLTLYDDGVHSDSAPDDLLFANTFVTDSSPRTYFIDLSISDSLGNTSSIAPIDRFTTISFTPQNQILIIDDTESFDNEYQWFTDYFAVEHVPFDVWKTTERGEIPYSILEQYLTGAVVWYTAKSTTQTISVNELNNITDFLDNGGNLLFTGEDTVYNISTIHGASFLNDYFHISFLKRDITLNSLIGVVDDPLTNGLAFPLTTDQIPGELSVSSPAEPILYFDQSEGSGNVIGYGITGIRIDTGTYKAVYLDFSWDGILSDPQRKLFLENIFTWFGIDQTSFLLGVETSPATIAPGDPMLISATIENTSFLQSVSAQIESMDEQPVSTILLFDDGTHGDITAADGIFSRSFLTMPSPQIYYIDIQLTRTDGTVLVYNNAGRFTTASEPMLLYSGFLYKSDDALQTGKVSYLAVAVSNIGNSSAPNVTCSLTLRDEYVSYYRTSAVEYGTVPPGATIYDPYSSYYISLNADCPNNYQFSGIVTIRDSSGSTATGTIEFTTADTTGPVINSITVSPQATSPGNTIRFYADVSDGAGVNSVQAQVSTFDGTIVDVVSLTYNASRGQYTSTWTVPSTVQYYKMTVLAEDILGNQSVSSQEEWFTSDSFLKENHLLVVIPKGTVPHEHPCVTALKSLGYAFDIWDRGLRGDITSYVSTQYAEETMIYCAGTLSSTNTISTTAQQRLTDFLNNDGNLLIYGGNLVYELTDGGYTANTLIDSFFKVEYVSYKMYINSILGVPGGIYDHDTFTLGGNLAGEITVTDTSARGVLKVKASVDPAQVQQYGYIATSVTGTGDSYRGVLLNFNLEDIEYPESRKTILNKAILWLQSDQSGVLVTDFSVTPYLANPSETFTFQAKIEDTSGINVALLYIYDDTDTWITTLMMYDDGAHNDGDADDSIYAKEWTAPSTPRYYKAELLIQNNLTKDYYFPDMGNFSTQPVPWVLFDDAVPTYYTEFVTSITNYFDLYLRNDGTVTAYDVNLTISTDDPRVTYITNTTTYSYGNIDAATTKKQNGSRLSFRTSTDCPNGTQIPFTIKISTASYSFTDEFTLTVYDQSAPSITNQEITPQQPVAGGTLDISASVSDSSGVSSVMVEISLLSGDPLMDVSLYDDGLHNDELENDGTYGNTITLPATPNDFGVKFWVQDTLGNEAYSYTELWFSTKQFEQHNKILVVDYHTTDPASDTPIEASLTRLGYAFDSWKTALRGQCDISLLAGYSDGIVIWDTKTGGYTSFPQDYQQLIIDYLDNEGNLILVGDQNVYYASNGGKATNTLMDDYLHVLYIQRNVSQKHITGVENDPIGNGVELDLSSTKAGEIDPLYPAESVLYLNPDDSTLSTGIVGVKVATDSYKAVLFDLQFDAIKYTSQQDKLLEQTIAWFPADTGLKLISCNATPTALATGEPVTISAELSDTSTVSEVTVYLTDNDGNSIDTITLYNDATHGDNIAGDSIFTTTYTPAIPGISYTIDLSLQLTNSSTYMYPECSAFYTNARSVFIYQDFTYQTGYDHFSPGNFTYFGITIQNIGTAAADNVQASLSVVDPHLLYNSTFAVNYGSMAVNESKTSVLNQFRIQPAYSCPDGYFFTGYITVTDNDGNSSVDTVMFTVDDTTAPYPSTLAISGTYFQVGDTVDIQTTIQEGSGVSYVNAIIADADTGYSYTLPLYDSGNHADGNANDSVYGNTFIIPFTPRDYTVRISTQDQLGNSKTWTSTKLFTSIPFTVQNRILLLDDDGGSSNVDQYYKDLLDTLGYPYDYWDCNLRGDVDETTLLRYLGGCVLLFTGSNTSSTRISANDQNNYIAYLDAGGAMIVSGSDNSYMLTSYGAQSNAFLNDYLHAQYQTRTYLLNDIEGISGTLFDGAASTLSYSYADESDPVPPGISVLTYSGDSLPYTQSSASAAIQTDTGIFKTMLFDFKMINITIQAQKEFIMSQTINWILGPEITNPIISDLHCLPGATIDISCSVSDSYPISNVFAQIEQPDETLVIEVILLDDGSGADLVAGDGIYSGQYTVPAGEFDYLIDLIAYNTNNNFGRLNNILSFSTKSIPHLTVTDFSPSEGSIIQSGKMNIIDIGIKNVGPVAAQSSSVMQSINNIYIDDYYAQSVSYGAIAPDANVYDNPSLFFITPSIFTANGQDVQVTISMTAYDASSNLYNYEETLSITIIDNDAPLLIASNVTPQNAQTDSLITITAQVQEGTGIDSIEAVILSNDGTPIETITLYDDGLHDDNQDNDFIFAGTWLTPSLPSDYHISIVTSDTLSTINTYTQVSHFTTVLFESHNTVLLINAETDNDTPVETIKTILDNESIGYDVWDTNYRGSITDTAVAQYQYGAILLIAGTNGINSLTYQDYTTLRSYLSAGGSLFICGENVSYHTENDDAASFFLNQYLYAYSVQNQTDSTYLTRTATGIGLPDSVELSATTQAGETDVITPAFSVLTYDTTTGGGQVLSSATGGFAVETSMYRAICLDFEINGIVSSDTQENLVTQAVSWLTDWDNDGLTDTWEIDYFGSREAQNGSSDPDCDGLTNVQEKNFGSNPLLSDTDNDGHSDRWEHIAGTDPLDPASKFIVGEVIVDNDGVTISWPSVPSKSYAIYYCDELPVFTLIDIVTATETMTSYYDAGSLPDRPNPSDKTTGFYIIYVHEQ